MLLRYALDVAGRLDTLALTCLDRLEALPEAQICRRYRDGQAAVERLVPGPAEPSLEYQETLTQQLFRCRPQLEKVDINQLPAMLTAETGVPVGLLSRGAGPAAKEIVPNCGL